MDINIKNQLQKILDRQLETTTETRFRIEGYSKETVQEMLLMCYQHEVRKRRIPFQEDKGTLEKIEKAAKWLTGDYKVGLLLYGIVGSGKSTLGKAICNLIGILHNSSISSERKGVFRVSALDLAKMWLMILCTSISSKSRTAFIDDIGTEPASVKVGVTSSHQW